MNFVLKKLFISPSLLFIILALLVLPFIYSTRVPDPSLSPRILALNILAFIFLMTILFRRKGQNPGKAFGFISNPIHVAYLGYLLFAGISVFFAINTQEALIEWMKMMLIYSFFVLLNYAVSQEKNGMEVIVKTIVVLAGLLCVRGFYEIFSVTSTMEFDHQSSYFIRAYSSNRNLFAQLLFLCLPFSLFANYFLKGWWRVVSVIATVGILILTVLLLTRSVWVAILVSSIITFILYFIRKKKAGITSKSIIYFLIVVVFLALVLLIYAQFADLNVFREQLYWISNYKFGSSLERVELWKKSLLIAQDHLITGVGPGNWKISYPEYGIMALRPDSGTTFFQRPHNDFLWVLAENGLPAFIFYVLIFFLAFKKLYHSLRNCQSDTQFYFRMALVFGLTGYLIFALLSFPRERIEHQVLLFTYFSFVVLIEPSSKARFQTPAKVFVKAIFILALLLLCMNLVLSSCRFTSEMHIFNAYTYRDQHNYKKVIKEIDKADKYCISLDTYSTPLVWYRGEARFFLNQKNKAFVDFQKAYAQNPNHIHVLNNLATSYELNGKHKQAKTLYKRALFIFPGFEDALLNLTAIYFNEGKMDSSLILLSKISPDTKNKRYFDFVNIVTKKKVEAMMDLQSERIIFKSMERIKNDDQWILKVFHQAGESQKDFESEIYREVIYLLESMDSTISGDEATRFRMKYNL